VKVDWYQLECFRVAGKLEHLSNAAKVLGTSQPAVSRAIGKLEERLGVSLFDRVGRSVRLTEQGYLLLQKVEKAHREIEGVQIALLESARAESRPTRIGFMRSLSVRVVPQLVSAYKSSQPHAQFNFVANNGSAIADLLESADLDLVFMAEPSDRPSITWKKLFDQRLVAIAPAASPLARKKLVSLRDLADQPIVTFKRPHVMRTLTERIFEEAGIQPQVAFEGDDSGSIPGFVAAGLGVAIVAQDAEFPRDIVILPTDGPLHVRQVGLAWIGDRFMAPSVREFREFTLRNAPTYFSQPFG
jgi:DNA-binding transcriptional LysR family regulator